MIPKERTLWILTGIVAVAVTAAVFLTNQVVLFYGGAAAMVTIWAYADYAIKREAKRDVRRMFEKPVPVVS